MKIRLKLFHKLTLSFLIAIIATLLTVVTVSYVMIQDRFNNYLHDMHSAETRKIAGYIQDEFSKGSNLYNMDKSQLTGYARFQGLYIKIEDIKGNVVADSGKEYLEERKPLPPKGITDEKDEMTRTLTYMEDKIDLYRDKTRIGTLTIGYYGVNNPSRQALTFKKQFKNVYPASAVIAILIGVLISLILSKQLAVPILEVVRTSQNIRTGNLKDRSKIKTSTSELQELSYSINCLAETLEAQDMLRKRLVTDISHEIRTPLTTLRNYLEAFIDGFWEPTPEKLESCHEEVIRITSLVDNIKYIASLEQSSEKLNKSKFNLSEEIEKVIDLYRPLCTKKEIDFDISIEPDVYVYMDRDKMKQIISNLLSNAYRYSNFNGKINVVLKKSVNDVVIKIKDYGIGIPKKDLPYIFERFYRTDVSRSRETGGTGIGLAIVKTLVDAHGGRIEVESEVNKGTEFTLTFNDVLKENR